MKYDTPLETGPASEYNASQSTIKVPKIDGKPSVEEVLEAILPARQYVEGGKCFEQHVSTEPSIRQDVMHLQAVLDETLKRRQARKEGLCPIRQELFTQLTDELIRQIAVNCPERGILLARIRDEMRMTIDAYLTLYESSVIFGTRKQLEVEISKVDVTPELDELKARRLVVEQEITDLELSLDTHSKRAAEREVVLTKKRAEELEYLQHQHSHLTTFLKTVEKQAAAAQAN